MRINGSTRTRAVENEGELLCRVSVADLWICPASDCWPTLFAGAYVQPMFGWQRVKFGGHLISGWINESRESSAGSTFLIAINPLIARVTF